MQAVAIVPKLELRYSTVISIINRYFTIVDYCTQVVNYSLLLPQNQSLLMLFCTQLF